MSTKIALSPLMEALVADQIMKHGNGDVKVSAVACMSEITRRTAPDAPYDDKQMTVAKVFSEDVVCPREVGQSGEESLKLNQRSTKKKLLVETADKPVKITQKRSWKPYFLVNPEEGYDYCWIGRKRANPSKIITEASSI
ncbi:hypothetical protein PVL29_011869 [Vitis rotundifolia]|uniref:Uncharacterized protein n=1 Tax=Vitis rotundifolia TaxID=103349 RepID=A0AA39DSV0_VITRO|nr:hypothetical protein PVL29_011869 [Vitis rotundifolia]